MVSHEVSSPLVAVAQLADQLSGDEPPVLIDVRWALGGPPGYPEFLVGHVPGAQFVDLETELSGPVRADRHGGRHPLPAAAGLTAILQRVGVRSDRVVVGYDAGTSLAAARVWWLLTDAGHPNVAVLDGGFAAWTAAGQPVQTGPAPEAAPGDFVAQPGHRERVDADRLAGLLADPDGSPVLDVRAAERYAATKDPVDPVAGHVPGALSVPSMANLGPDGRFRPAAEIAERYANAPNPVLYCGSGITAAHSLLALESAGLSGRIYPGSWSDWISDSDRPVAVGTDPG